MVQYWWVNQTDQHKIERNKEIVAARKSESGVTHWGRENVAKMNTGDRIICYRSKTGIDSAACVMKNCGIGPAPWDYKDDNGVAYIAKVRYFAVNPIPKNDFINQMLRFAGRPKGPFLANGNIRFAYAMCLEKEEFGAIFKIIKKSQPNVDWPSD